MSIKDKLKGKKKPKVKTVGKYAAVKLQSLKLADLEEAPFNARLITAEALAGLASSLEDFGLLGYPVVNLRPEGPRIVGGHQRLKVLQKQGVEETECIVVKFDDETEKRANFALNNRAIQGQFVPELTRALLLQIEKTLDGQAQQRFKALRFDLLLRKSLKEIEHVAGVDDVALPGEYPDDYVPGIIKTKPASQPGAFYQLGQHRLYCGKLEAKGSLKGFGVDAASMAFTEMVHSADLSKEYVDVYLAHLLANTEGAIYIATNQANLPLLQDRLPALGGHWSNTLLWINPHKKANDDPYTDVTIPVLYGWREGLLRYYCGSRDHGNVLRLKQKFKHFPVEIAVHAILNSSKKGDAVLDTDAQKGASVIAAEKTGRRLVGYARTPTDCDQVRRRWVSFTSGKLVNWKGLTPEVK